MFSEGALNQLVTGLGMVHESLITFAMSAYSRAGLVLEMKSLDTSMGLPLSN